MSDEEKPQKTPEEIWLEYINSLTWQKGSLDNSSWNAFLRAGSLEIDVDDAASEVAQRIENAGTKPPEEKLKSQLKRAYGYADAHVGEIRYEKRQKLVYEPGKLQRVADKLDVDVTTKWLATVSPLSVRGRSPAGFLQVLFKPGECVIVFDVFESQGHIWEHRGRSANLWVNHLQRGYQNVWFASNPVDGAYHWNPRQGKESRRSEEAVTSWRYAVLESDHAPKDLWLKTLVQLPIPIAAIYDSGGSSIHALVLVNADSKAEWDSIIRGDLAECVVPLGADFQAMTAIRLTRLPNCVRSETGQLQRLLYLNPAPDYTPIASKEAIHGA